MKPRSYGPRKRTKQDRTTEAVLFLAGARSIEHVTREWLVARFDIPAATAEQMLATAREVRAA